MLRGPVSRSWLTLGLGVLALGAGAAALAMPDRRGELLTLAAGILVGAGAADLFSADFERFVGLRYLRRARGAPVVGAVLAVGALFTAAGLGLFFATRGASRAGATVGIVLALAGSLIVLVGLLLRAFSVFTAVSATGVMLGVASLVVVMEVTSGFEHEFQDKVLGLNAHLIVIPYGQVGIDSSEIAEVKRKLAGMPGVVRTSQFVFSAGEVMVGKVGANLKGIDLREGGDDLRRALVAGSVEDLARPAACPIPEAVRAPGEPAEKPAPRIILGAELARRLRVAPGGCVPVLVPFTGRAADPPHFLFKVVGLFRMGFHEYDTRLAYVSLDDARTLAGAREQVVGVELRFSDPSLALGAVAEVKRRLVTQYRVIDWKDLNHNLFQALTMQKVMISVFLLLIVVVATFNILASLTLIVLSKVREIAILKSMGSKAGRVARIFLVAGTTVGAVGTGLGLGFGLLMCQLARLYGYPLDPKVYLIGELPVRFEPSEILGVAAGTLVICLLATLYPALRATGMRAVDGLRYD